MESAALRTARTQLDRRYARMAGFRVQPPGGWLRTVRRALGMTMRQMASRMGKSNSAIVQIERGELSGSLSLQRLRAAADAMDCDVFHVVIPRQGGIGASLRARAETLARALVARTDLHMGLEDQSVGEEEREAQVAELVATLLRRPRDLWDEAPGR